MTLEDKNIINAFVDHSNRLLSEEFRLVTKWYEDEYNGHTVSLISTACDWGTASTMYESAYSWVDGYTKGINTAYRTLQGSISHELVKA